MDRGSLEFFKEFLVHAFHLINVPKINVGVRKRVIDCQGSVAILDGLVIFVREVVQLSDVGRDD